MRPHYQDKGQVGLNQVPWYCLDQLGVLFDDILLKKIFRDTLKITFWVKSQKTIFTSSTMQGKSLSTNQIKCLQWPKSFKISSLWRHFNPPMSACSTYLTFSCKHRTPVNLWASYSPLFECCASVAAHRWCLLLEFVEIS